MKVLGLTAILLSTLLVGCGSDIYVANDVRFKVSFEKKSLQVSFDLNPAYQIKESQRKVFSDLGILALKWDGTTHKNEIGSLLYAKPENLRKTWPTHEMKKLPNQRSLPSAVRTKSLRAWRENTSSAILEFIFQSEPHVIVGGGFLSKDFQNLPTNFFAIQNFSSPHKDVRAQLCVLGPAKDFSGGLYWFANFGTNPFLKSQEETAFEIEATSPIQIISWGKGPKREAQFSSESLLPQLPVLLDTSSPQWASAQ